ncbi:acyltransferase [Sphingobium amiense]|uniref:Acyltransferase n=1 Tax=Sphingobium amiense TaxID=135719 RepID=A0A494WG76_9SPHN|nr:acyltransferase [Sphingobium amiense]BBD99719.1 acyltransferase [Sphingobium amiense]
MSNRNDLPAHDAAATRPAPDPHPDKLISLEAGRFFAALGVVLFHYTALVEDFTHVTVLANIFRPGHVGVPYFFVLSGFIMYHVHRRDMGRANAVRYFAVRRAIRLFPMFWGISLVMLIGFLMVPSLAVNRPPSMQGIVFDLLLLPHKDAILAISWTLRHEVVFYLFFSLMLLFGNRALWLVGLWIFASLTGAAFHLDRLGLGNWSIVGSNLNLGFGLGILCAMGVARPSDRHPLWWIVGGGGALALLGALEWHLGRFAPHGEHVLGQADDIGYLIAAAALIYGLAKMEKRLSIPGAGLWKMLGGASYLLYLLHQPMGSVLVRIMPVSGLSPLALFALVTLAATLASVMAHLLVERPITAWLSRNVRVAKPVAASAAAA